MDRALLPEGYEQLKRLHEGRHTRVYEAVRLSDGRPVVLKLHAADGSAGCEVEALRAAEGPGVPRVLAQLQGDDPPGLVLERLSGATLATWAAEASLDLGAFLGHAVQLSDVLARVHAARFLHGRIHPRNVLIDSAVPTAHLLGFSQARPFGSDTRGRSHGGRSSSGDPRYAAPEQSGRMNRGVDPRSDLYQLGATLYHALIGRPPFESDDAMELLHAHMARLPEPPHLVRPSVPLAVSRIAGSSARARAPSGRHRCHTELLAEALHRPPDETRTLAKQIHRKTAGSPLLIQQLTERLHNDGLLTHDAAGRWVWDEDAVAAASLSDDAVALISSRIRRLPLEIRDLLEFAGCVGDEFDAALLEDLSHRSRPTLEAALYALCDEGLITACPSGFRFAHDRIRESAQALLSAAERAKLHADIARWLIERTPLQRSAERAREIADHLARGVACILEPERLDAVRRLVDRTGDVGGRRRRGQRALSGVRSGPAPRRRCSRGSAARVRRANAERALGRTPSCVG